jgi:hypothetical protein
LKAALKAAAKERDKVRGARKDARKAAAKANQRAAKAEARYDDAVLAGMLRREKNSDLSAHSSVGPSEYRTPASNRLEALAPHTGDGSHSSTVTRPRSRTPQ